MDMVSAIVLGALQGLAEFLPISSSGHLVLGGYFFGFQENELLFNVSLHMGTLIAVIFYFRQDLIQMVVAAWRFGLDVAHGRAAWDPAQMAPHMRMVTMIAVASVPTAIIGLGFSRIADRLFSSLLIVGAMLLVTGTVLWLTRRMPDMPEASERFTVRKALYVGLVQGLAILPGISRSGATISAGIFLGLNRATAARFSFLMSIPAIVGAEVIGLKDIGQIQVAHLQMIGVGTLTAALVGYGALWLLVLVVDRGRLHLFAPYCWVLGALTLGWAWMH
jgi:undecaprenyl-diphosphatase